MEAYLLAIGTIGLIYVLLSLGLNLQYGMTGLINFGHVGFFCIGAYTATLLAEQGLPPVATFVVAAVLAAIAAWPLGIVSLKLSDDYFAIVTLGFSEIVRIVVTSEQWLTNGVQGIPNIPKLFGSLSETMQPVAVVVSLLAVTIAAVAVMRRISRSPFGRAIEAIRDNEVAMKSLGKDPAGFKMRVLMLGAALAGVAGAFYAHYIGFISPEQFLPLITFQIWMAIIMGGAGRVSGSVVGTAILMLFLEGSRFLRDAIPIIPDVQMASIRLGVIGLTIILFTLYRPQGLMGDYTKR